MSFFTPKKHLGRLIILAALSFSTHANDIVVGQVASLSGSNGADLGQELRLGVNVYFQHINDNGGIDGNKLRLISEDDRYIPEETVKLTEKLLQDPNLVALTSFRGTANTIALIKSGLLEKSGVPLVGTLTGATEVQGAANIFHSRTSYSTELRKLVKQLHGIGLTRVGVFYANDAFGKSGLNSVQLALKELGTQYVAAFPYEQTNDSIDKGAQQLGKADINAVIMIAVGEPAYAFLKALRTANPNIQAFSMSVVNYAIVVERLGVKDSYGIGFSQTFPYPFSDTTPLAREYRNILKKYAPKNSPTYFSMEGYINAKILVEAMRKAKKPLTAASVHKALASLTTIDLGGFPLKFDPATRNGSEFVDLTIIGRSGHLLH